jgi:hypothetical protein
MDNCIAREPVWVLENPEKKLIVTLCDNFVKIWPINGHDNVLRWCFAQAALHRGDGLVPDVEHALQILFKGHNIFLVQGEMVSKFELGLVGFECVWLNFPYFSLIFEDDKLG